MQIIINPKKLSNYAKSLKKQLAGKGLDIKHTEVLNMLAQMVGHRDANSLIARLKTENAIIVPPSGDVPEDRVGYTAYYRQREDTDSFEIGIRFTSGSSHFLSPCLRSSDHAGAKELARKLADDIADSDRVLVDANMHPLTPSEHHRAMSLAAGGEVIIDAEFDNDTEFLALTQGRQGVRITGRDGDRVYVYNLYDCDLFSLMDGHIKREQFIEFYGEDQIAEYKKEFYFWED